MSKSGTLTYQMMYELREIGFSTAIGIGGDPVVGTTHIDALAAFEADPDTAAVVMIGEIGGDAEERAAEFIQANVTKPVVGYVAGFTAPEGKTMGHAGAIVSGSAGTAQAKKEALEAAGVKVGKTPERDRRTDARTDHYKLVTKGRLLGVSHVWVSVPPRQVEGDPHDAATAGTDRGPERRPGVAGKDRFAGSRSPRRERPWSSRCWASSERLRRPGSPVRSCSVAGCWSAPSPCRAPGG